MIDTAWVLLSLTLFIIACIIADRLGPPVKETDLDEDEVTPPENPKERSEPTRPLFETDGKAFLKSLERGTTNMPEKVVFEQTNEIEEIYPERLSKLRAWEGFRSSTFEKFWKKSNGREKEWKR